MHSRRKGAYSSLHLPRRTPAAEAGAEAGAAAEAAPDLPRAAPPRPCPIVAVLSLREQVKAAPGGH